MRYKDYLAQLRYALPRAARMVRYGEVVEGGETFPLVSVIVPDRPSVWVTAGFHGEEPAGPLTFLEHGRAIVEHALAAGVGLHIFPCVNPSGFQDGTRYNRSDESPNNAFLEYEVSSGEWKDSLPPGATCSRWQIGLAAMPKETRALYRALCAAWADGAPAALLDLHQDDELEGKYFYAYIFGDSRPYLPLVDACRSLATPYVGEVDRPDDLPLFTDAGGLTEHHDGGIQDWAFHRGVRHTATLETTTRTPRERATAINRLWVSGLIELVARTPLSAACAARVA